MTPWTEVNEQPDLHRQIAEKLPGLVPGPALVLINNAGHLIQCDDPVQLITRSAYRSKKSPASRLNRTPGPRPTLACA